MLSAVMSAGLSWSGLRMLRARRMAPLKAVSSPVSVRWGMAASRAHVPSVAWSSRVPINCSSCAGSLPSAPTTDLPVARRMPSAMSTTAFPSNVYPCGRRSPLAADQCSRMAARSVTVGTSPCRPMLNCASPLRPSTCALSASIAVRRCLSSSSRSVGTCLVPVPSAPYLPIASSGDFLCEKARCTLFATSRAVAAVDWLGS